MTVEVDGGRQTVDGRPARWPAPFRSLVQAQVAHAAGDALVALALADTLFFSVPVGEARDKVALYLALTMAPFALLSPVVGPWLDGKAGAYRMAIAGAMVGRLMLVVGLASRTDRLVLYPLAFGLLALSRVHGVSRSALVPAATPPGRSLVWANSRLAVASALGGAVGGTVGAALTRWGGPDPALWMAGAAFGVGNLLSFGLPVGRTGGDDIRTTNRAAYRSHIGQQVHAAGISMAASRAGVGYLTFFLAFLIKSTGADDRGLVAVALAAAAGGLVGSALAPSLRRVLNESLLLLASLLGMGAAALWGADRFGLVPLAAVVGVFGFAAGAGRLAFDSLLQQDVPPGVRGRAIARYETIFQLSWVVAACGAIFMPVEGHTGLWTLAGGLTAAAALTAVGLLRARRGDGEGRRPPAEEPVPQRS